MKQDNKELVSSITVKRATWKLLLQKKLDLDCPTMDDLIFKLLEKKE